MIRSGVTALPVVKARVLVIWSRQVASSTALSGSKKDLLQTFLIASS
jgi:hypothetical protein